MHLSVETNYNVVMVDLQIQIQTGTILIVSLGNTPNLLHSGLSEIRLDDYYNLSVLGECLSCLMTERHCAYFIFLYVL